MSKLVHLEIDESIAVVTFDNPPRGYMDAAQVAELDVIID